MDLIQRYLCARALSVVTAHIRVALCDHEWVEYGHGYKCVKCKHYSGLNTEMNNLIAAALKKKRTKTATNKRKRTLKRSAVS